MTPKQHVSPPGLSTQPLCDALGLEITGLDLTQRVTEDLQQELQRLLTEHRLLLLRSNHLTAQDQVRFANIFGRIEIRQDYESAPSVDPDTQYVSNTRADGILGSGELDFHHDQLFQKEPLRALILYGVEVPETGGETSFIHTSKVYRSMPQELQHRISDKSCLHLYDFKGDYTGFQDLATASEGSPQANHPIVYQEPETGEPAVWVNRLTTIRVNELSAQESRELISEVRAYLHNEAFIYHHKWRKGDLLIWDNRILQHARGAFDARQPRTLRRTPIV